MANNNNKNKICDVNEKIKGVRANHDTIKKEKDKVTDKLRSERDQACEERHQMRVKKESMTKELVDARKELQRATEELRKLKDLADEEISSLTAERDDSIEQKLEFEQEYEDNKEKLKFVKEQLVKIQEDYRILKEHREEITDQLVNERDNASDERYRARVRRDEINKEILEAEGKVAKTQIQYRKLKDDTDDVNNRLAAERDRFKDDSRKFNDECEEKVTMLVDLDKGKHEKSMSTQKLTNTATKHPTSVLIQEPHKAGNDSGIEIDLDAVTREIKNQVEIVVDEKLSNLGIDTKKAKPYTVPKNENEGRIFGGNSRLDNADTRELNIIIHGINENNENDEVFIQNLFDIMEMDSTGPTIAHRLGEKRKDQPRPMKIVMESKNHKAEFMSKLWKLKHADNAYKKIRVTDDHTWEERQDIRRWVKMANDRNENDNNDDEERLTNYAWKMRGSPKTGMRIVRVRIQ